MSETDTNKLSTVTRRFLAAVTRFHDRPAVSSKPHGAKVWETLTFGEVGAQVRQLSLGLRALGIERGDRVAILSENRAEWVIADQAILAAGAVSVPIYPTLPASQVAYILADSGAKMVIASDSKQAAKVSGSRESLPNVPIVITMDANAEGEDRESLAEVMRLGSEFTGPEDYEARAMSVKPDDLMSLVYTSGTTGNPKGVMLTHGSMVASLVGAERDLPQYRPPDEVMLSFLPLCHIFERVTYTLALTLGARTYFNDSLFRLADNMAEVKPTVMVNVPRVFESICEKTLEGIAKAPPKRQKLVRWALGVGGAYAERHNTGRWVSPALALQQGVADKLVLSKIRERFGGRFTFVVSGGAPLNIDTARFFFAIGIPILEVWGLTEVGLATINPYGKSHIGTVGKASANTSVAAAADGELLVHGPNVMQGYWHNPEATAEAIRDGWFHTGDIGEIDSSGYVKITDRKKDLLVLANGKKVAPQPIEVLLKRSPYVSEIVLLGDKSETVKALVVPNFDAVRAWAKEQGRQDKQDNAALIGDASVRKLIKTDIDTRAGDLADFERIKRIALIDHAFTIEGGELTPTLKVKRKVVAERFGHLLERESQ